MVSGLAGGDLALSPLLESMSPFLVRQHVATSSFRSLQRCAPAHTHRVWLPLIFRKRTIAALVLDVWVYSAPHFCHMCRSFAVLI